MGIVVQVEDNELNRRLIERLIERWDGVALTSASTGREGLSLAAELKPDLVLLDLDLPDMNGLEVLDRIRRDERYTDISVVVISADASKSTQDGLAARGATACLTKPLDIATFDAVVGPLLELPGS